MIRVIVADDENLIREALVSLLQLTADIDVVAQAADGDAALAHARKLAPDVAVLDLQMPGRSGIAVAEALASELPACRSIIVTSHGLPGHLKNALSAGVRGFVPKTISGARLAEVIRDIHAGGRYRDWIHAFDEQPPSDRPLVFGDEARRARRKGKAALVDDRPRSSDTNGSPPRALPVID